MQHYKCSGCSINIPLLDVEEYQEQKRCPFGKNENVCPFKQDAAGSKDEVESQIQSQTACRSETLTACQPKRVAVWVEMQNKQGVIYYHNTLTGKDQWERPPDFERKVEEGSPEGQSFVPFKDQTKTAILEAQQNVEKQRENFVPRKKA